MREGNKLLLIGFQFLINVYIYTLMHGNWKLGIGNWNGGFFSGYGRPALLVALFEIFVGESSSDKPQGGRRCRWWRPLKKKHFCRREVPVNKQREWGCHAIEEIHQ